MPNLGFKILGATPAHRGIVPLLQFKLEIANEPAEEAIQSVILQVQIQIQSPQRAYAAGEKEKLIELFGTPDQWGNTLRNRLWTHANTNVAGFTGRTETRLSVPCSFDLNVAATKYFYALEGGEVPLLFLFSGTVFYTDAEARLQAQQISWNCEATYRMPIEVWRELMEHHYPNSAWVVLERESFDRLYAFRRRAGCGSWEQTIARLLQQNDPA